MQSIFFAHILLLVRHIIHSRISAERHAAEQFILNDSHVKGYHAYLDDWKPCRREVLQAIPEPNNAVDKYVVCVLKDGEVVGHLKRGKCGCFAKTIFYFLEADQDSSCSMIIKADKAVNFGDGEGMQVPCKLRISGQEKFVNILKKELERLEK